MYPACDIHGILLLPSVVRGYRTPVALVLAGNDTRYTTT